MVGFKELRDVVLDPLVEFADHARRIATELEQFGVDTHSQKSILSAVWEGIDAISAISRITGHADDYQKTSTDYRQIDGIIGNLANQIRLAKGMLDSAISMAPSIPGSIDDTGAITINYAALGANPAPAAVAAAQQRALQVREYLRRAVVMANDADRAAQAELNRLLSNENATTPGCPVPSPVGGDQAAVGRQPVVGGENGSTPVGGDAGQPGGDSASPGDGEVGTGQPGDGSASPGDGEVGTGQPGDGSGSPGSGQPGGQPGSGQPGGGDGNPGGGKTPSDGGQTPVTRDQRSDRQLIGDIMDKVGEALSGGDGPQPGERSDLQIIGDIIEGIGEALSGGDGDGAMPPPTTVPPPDVTLPPPTDPGDGTTPPPGDGDGTTPPPGDGDTPPGDGDTPPGDGDTPPGDGDTPPGDGDGDTPPDDGDGTTPPPGDGDTPPGDGDGDGETPGDGDGGDGDNDGDGDGDDDGDGDGPVTILPVGDLNTDQMANAVRIVEIGESLGISERGQAIALATAMQESSFRNLANTTLPDSLDIPNEGTGSDHDSVGLFQQRPSQGWGSIAECMDVEYATTKFYEELQRVDGWEDMEVAEAAQAVQRSAHPDAYARWEGMADEILQQVEQSRR
ncbi:hypothetical protein FB566_3784 [Stackebrandtia endophytica]|uniref:Uncharacterized protein n=1 Tax=Stackebrandtia endophytica TaxID=1496996 RepID=A0A543B035_9ACTN|nr:hypothetical protein [Stackebrandtia endophytica]TQL78202.1 hypothetical protein FB566_3784 [Stackebrandtia endophytica]